MAALWAEAARRPQECRIVVLLQTIRVLVQVVAAGRVAFLDKLAVQSPLVTLGRPPRTPIAVMGSAIAPKAPVPPSEQVSRSALERATVM